MAPLGTALAEESPFFVAHHGWPLFIGLKNSARPQWNLRGSWRGSGPRVSTNALHAGSLPRAAHTRTDPAHLPTRHRANLCP